MAKSQVKKVIKFLEEKLKEKELKVSQIILFGSQVKGRVTEDSDIDVVIVSEDFRGKNIFERVKLIKEPEILTIKKFMIPIDIIMLTPEELESETSLVAAYAKEGEVLYAR